MFSRIAKTVTDRPVTVLVAWALVVLAALPLAQLAPAAMTAGMGFVSGSEAARTKALIARAFGQEDSDSTIVVTRSTLPPTDGAFRVAYDRLADKMAGLGEVRSLTRYYSPSPLTLFGKVDGSYVTATIVEAGGANPDEAVASLRGVVRGNRLPDTEVLVTGASAVSGDLVKIAEEDAKRSELSALPLVAIVLAGAFGALVAAGIPLMVGLISVSTSMAAIFLLTHLMPVSVFSQSVITILGLGAGIDYALLMVNRFREELARGLEPRAAAALSARTAGRAVAFSGLTVATAMAALLVPDLSLIRSIGIGGVLVILVTVLSSTTAVPAALALLGERVNSPRGLRLRLRSGTRGRGWYSWASRVMQRPWLSAALVTAFLLALAAPMARMQLGNVGAAGLSPSVEARRALDLIRPLDLGGSLDTFELVVDLGEDRYGGAARTQFRDLDASLAAMPGVRLVISPFLTARWDASGAGGGLGDLVGLFERSISQDRRYLRLSVIPGEPLKAGEIAAWERRLREAAQGAGFDKVLIGGSPVESEEFTRGMLQATPVAVGLVFVATFVLLAIAFRSLLIPLTSIVMNALTVGATFGVITLVFQDGVGAALLGADVSAGVIDATLPLLLFSVIFGLSLDYQVFLLARIQEGHEAGLTTTEAIAEAVDRTAGVITSAALIMLVVFIAFIPGNLATIKAVGVGLATAIALDATLVRLVLVPAVLKLAGEGNWWLPQHLKRLMPRLGLEH